MDVLDILDSVCANIANQEEFASNPISIQFIKEGFERPSFFVSFTSDHSSDYSFQISDRQTAIQIFYFAKKDAGDEIDSVQQYEAYQRLRNLFNIQSLKVLDRFIKIDSIDGGFRDNDIYLDIVFHYADIAGNATSDDMYEKIKELNVKYNKPNPN